MKLRLYAAKSGTWTVFSILFFSHLIFPALIYIAGLCFKGEKIESRHAICRKGLLVTGHTGCWCYPHLFLNVLLHGWNRNEKKIAFPSVFRVYGMCWKECQTAYVLMEYCQSQTRRNPFGMEYGKCLSHSIVQNILISSGTNGFEIKFNHLLYAGSYSESPKVNYII